MIAAALALLDSPVATANKLTLVSLTKEGHSHVIDVREGCFEVRRRGAKRPLLRFYKRDVAQAYFDDVEANRARETRFESWQANTPEDISERRPPFF